MQTPADNLSPMHQEGSYLMADAHDLPDDMDDDEGWIDVYTKPDLALATQPPTEEERAESSRESDVTYRREKESGTMATKGSHSDPVDVRWPRSKLGQVKCPTVVIHAVKDQFFPLAHAGALRDGVERATQVVVEDCGYGMPVRARPLLMDKILANAKKGEWRGRLGLSTCKVQLLVLSVIFEGACITY